MESKKINQLATELAPDLSDLTIIGDPTTGISKKITLSQMASLFTGTVEEYANLAAFPITGVADTIYIALDTNVIYRWDSTSYVVLSPNIIASLVFNDANGFDGTISLVGSVATLTITTALTSGSVPFIGASGALTQDNSNLFFDDTNNRLGIATASPTTPLDVFGSGIIGRLNATSTNNAYLGFASNGTNKWSAGNVQSDHRFRIFSEANSAELITILQTGEFGIGIANPLTKLHIDGGATALIANLDANVSVAKSVSYRSDNSARINLEVSGTESGSNAGADLFIRTYTDAGSLLATPLTITRSTGAITLTGALSSTFVGQFLDNTGASTSSKIIRISNTGGDMAIGIEGSTPTEIPAAEGGIAYSTVLKSVGTTSLILGTLSKAALIINTSQQVTLTQNLTGTTAIFSSTLGLSGALSGTSASFTSTATASAFIPSGATVPTNGMYLSAANTLNFATNATNRLSISSTGAATFSSLIIAATLSTIGTAVAATNVQLNLNGVTGKAQRIEFQHSGVQQWLIGCGASSETNAFEIFNSTGANSMAINKSTNAVTFSSTIASTGASFSGDINLSGSAEINHTGRIIMDAGTGNGFLFRTNNVATTAISIASNGEVASVPVYNNTTANSANMYIFSDGSFTRSTSSLRFKTNVETLDNNISETIYKMRPIWYRSLCEKDKKDWSWYGFGAEELAILEPRLVHWAYKKEDYFTNEETSEQELKEGAELIADGVQYERIIVLLVAEMQKMRKELDELKAK